MLCASEKTPIVARSQMQKEKTAMARKLQNQPVACRCGGQAIGPERRERKRGFAIRCSQPGCPALVMRPHAADAVEAWNDMSTCVNK